jgi:hypothetical protein
MARLEILSAAKKYIAMGWKVFPCHTISEDGECSCGRKACTDAGKHPRTDTGLKEASSDTDQIEAWFGAGSPPSNIGVVTGKVSGITVIDIDIGHGKLGAESWSALIAEKGEPNTLMSKTGSGGLHVLFKYNSALRTGTNRLGKGIDIRGDGGYIIAPPSRHRSGGVYEWMNDTQLDDLPEHLLAKKKDLRGSYERQKKYTAVQIKKMLDHIPQEDRDTWRNVGVILGREFSRSEDAWKMYCDWSGEWEGKKGRNHDEIMKEAFYVISQDPTSGSNLSVGTLVYLAIGGGWTPETGVVPIQNFVFFAPGNNYIYRPTASFWIGAAVDCAVGKVNSEGQLLKASQWLQQHMLATSMTKTPALEGDYIKGFDCREGDLIVETGSAVFNAYRRPVIELGDANLASPFLDHVKRVFDKPGDADQFLDYMAHRVQFPAQKPRFALLIAGDQGVGKDTAVEFCVPAIGAWNVANTEPAILDSAYNEYVTATLVRVSEAANLHDMSKWAFNERMKVLIAGSPDYATVNPKYGHTYSVKMHCGVIVTTNHLLTGIYIPSDDRRYDVIDCASKSAMGLTDDTKVKEYFTVLWEWFNDGGFAHVAALLHRRDISKFSPNNGQRKTYAHQSVVSSSFTSDHEFLDALHEMGEPDMLRSDAIMAVLMRNGSGHAKDYGGRLSPALMRQKYFIHRNPLRADSRWKYDGKLATVYVKQGSDPTNEKLQSLKVPF